MVQETVTWFSWKNSPTASTTLVVAGQPVEQAPLVASAPPTDVRNVNPTPGRFDLWRAALAMATDFPLLGVGPDSFRWQFGAYAGLEEWDTGIHANNLYIEWLADTGLLGFLAFLWLTWRLASMSLEHLRHIRPETTWLLTLGLVASMLAWYVHGFFDYFFEFTPTYVAFWLIVGLLAGAPFRRQDGITDRI
jgi:O-antigen ligase